MFGSAPLLTPPPLPKLVLAAAANTSLIPDEQTWLPGPPSIIQQPASNFRMRGKGFFFLSPHAGSGNLLLGMKDCCFMANPFWIRMSRETPVSLQYGSDSQPWTGDDICTFFFFTLSTNKHLVFFGNNVLMMISAANSLNINHLWFCGHHPRFDQLDHHPVWRF